MQNIIKNNFIGKKLVFVILLINSICLHTTYCQETGEDPKKKNSNEIPKDTLFIFKPISSLIDSSNTSQSYNSFRYYLDILFSGSGLGFGTTISKQYSSRISGFASLGISGFRNKDEFEDWVADTVLRQWVVKVPNKINRLYSIPISIGAKYKMVDEGVMENIFPFLNIGLGPSLVARIPYEDSFLSALPKVKFSFTLGGFVGIGTDIGTSSFSSTAINLRYYYIPINPGIESLLNDPIYDFGGFFITLNIKL